METISIYPLNRPTNLISLGKHELNLPGRDSIGRSFQYVLWFKVDAPSQTQNPEMQQPQQQQ